MVLTLIMKNTMIVIYKILLRKPCMKYMAPLLMMLCLLSCSDADNTPAPVIDKQAGSATVMSPHMADGDMLALPKNSVKADKRIDFVFEPDKLDEDFSITIGHGYGDNLSSWCVLSKEKIETHLYNGTDEVTTIPFSLSMTSKTHVTIDKGLSGTRATLKIVSGTDSLAKSVRWIGDNGNTNGIFATVSHGSLKNCSLTWQGKCLTYEIWMFGDSYFALDNPARWTYYLLQDDHTNILFNAYSGAQSQSIIQDFENLLKISKPQMAIWCLGMNDKDNNNKSLTSTMPNSSWLAATQKFLSLCKRHDIVPVLATIPSVIGGRLATSTPEAAFRYHGAKNKWVKNSGCRYIDFATAVGADDQTGYWLGEGTNDHMLEGTDNRTHTRVHPTASGAKALYQQALRDCPELSR